MKIVGKKSERQWDRGERERHRFVQRKLPDKQKTHVFKQVFYRECMRTCEQDNHMR